MVCSRVPFQSLLSWLYTGFGNVLFSIVPIASPQPIRKVAVISQIGLQRAKGRMKGVDFIEGKWEGVTIETFRIFRNGLRVAGVLFSDVRKLDDGAKGGQIT